MQINFNRGDGERQNSEPVPLDVGFPAPLFTLNDADGDRPYSLSEALERGPVLIGIYKSSCEASKTAFPFLEKLHQAYPALTVWGVAQDSPNVTRSFTRRTGVTFPMLIDDNDYAVSRAYAIQATPSLFLLDGAGTVVWHRMGFQKTSMSELSQVIADLLGVAPVDILAGSENVPTWVPG
ncbi:MAG TPA: TlpA disulfide reductase family protein [Nitrolancea sp.]|nr:TlpA disulfide reductase family protein [Nitrolancea sp.]